jgi:alpha-L-fucosidase
MKNTLLTIFLCVTLQTVVKAQWSYKEGTDIEIDSTWWHLYHEFSVEEWEASNFATEEEMAWFNDARYGMFIHFGLSTYKGEELSWGVSETRKAPDTGAGTYPDSVWTQWDKEFRLEKFDAKAWVKLAQDAGMKYIVAIAKHHDGFHLWDTKHSDFKITNTPFGRDYLKELADACHEAGMKFGIYYSQRDWYHPDYAPVDVGHSANDPGKSGRYQMKKGAVNHRVVPGASHQKYIDYQFDVVKELCTNYGKVDVFWFDALWFGGMFNADMWKSEKLTRMIRELQPGIIINNRASLPGDFDTPEQEVGMYQERPWESCMTLCETWSWSKTPVKSKKEIIDMLTATASGNGNLLLSWGPQWNGAYDPIQIDRLKEVGDWLKQYGHTIYGTKGGPWRPEKWGGSTRKGNKIYVHIADKSKLKLELATIESKIQSAKCITGGEVSFDQHKNGTTINIENPNPDAESIIVELVLD